MKHTYTTKKNEVLHAFTIVGTKLRDTFGNQGHQCGGYLCVISGCMSFILGGYFISYCNIYFFLGTHGSWSWNLLCTFNEQYTYDSRGRRRPKKIIFRNERKERGEHCKRRGGHELRHVQILLVFVDLYVVIFQWHGTCMKVSFFAYVWSILRVVHYWKQRCEVGA